MNVHRRKSTFVSHCTGAVWLIVLSAFSIAGCATSGNSTSSSGQQTRDFENKSNEIARSEQECVNRAHQKSASVDTRNSEIAKCEAAADEKMGTLAAHDRDKYEQQQREEFDRNALMMTLTASPIR
ncbi:MAG TPA: hypothetical protein VMU16_00235 [Candidatus Binataceae bacterium]|nr:hypothetical protein [Candidatus Binataceae bacterium]